VNAATLALIDAGIPLRDYVTACTASLVEDKPLVDISSLESTQGGPELTVVSRYKFIDYCKVKLYLYSIVSVIQFLFYYRQPFQKQER